jgi:hypothetical protein
MNGFGMSHEKIASGNQLIGEPVEDFFLRRPVKVNNDITAKDDRHLFA